MSSSKAAAAGTSPLLLATQTPQRTLRYTLPSSETMPVATMKIHATQMRKDLDHYESAAILWRKTVLFFMVPLCIAAAVVIIGLSVPNLSNWNHSQGILVCHVLSVLLYFAVFFIALTHANNHHTFEYYLGGGADSGGHQQRHWRLRSAVTRPLLWLVNLTYNTLHTLFIWLPLVCSATIAAQLAAWILILLEQHSTIVTVISVLSAVSLLFCLCLLVSVCSYVGTVLSIHYHAKTYTAAGRSVGGGGRVTEPAPPKDE
jgi:hypothetical protein